jgi:hypothetical protein
MRRRAGEDVSIYTRKKQESTEYEMRKGQKMRRKEEKRTDNLLASAEFAGATM